MAGRDGGRRVAPLAGAPPARQIGAPYPHTPPPMIERPDPSEYDPYYARYVDVVPSGDPVALLRADLDEARAFYSAIGDARAGTPYAAGKWSVKDVVQHVADNERVMTYRALRAARGDATPLPGYEQDDFVRAANAGSRTLSSLLDELAAVRAGTIALFASLDDATAARSAVANGARITGRGLLYIILGHDRHHRRLLAELGLGAAA